MGIKSWLANKSGLMTAEQAERLVADEVKRAKAALPITADYDKKGEGYRRLTGEGQQTRDLAHVSQSRMFEIAYWMWDASAMFRGLLEMDRRFFFDGDIEVHSEDEAADKVLARMIEDERNNLPLDYPDLMEWLSALGEQCWPVEVSAHNGHVTLNYYDPAEIKEVYVLRENVKVPAMVQMQGRGGRTGEKLACVRVDRNPANATYGRLVGECFFFAINHPPNSPRGRSDYLTLYDWIDNLERYGYNVLERGEILLNYVWDVMLKGMSEDQIRDWLKSNKPPEPGSIRAHNENVTWQAVAPQLNTQDMAKAFDLGKSFIMGASRRPESWWGGGGKAYQTEAEQFGQVPIKDMGQRQKKHKSILERVCRFQLDQAVIHGRLTAEQADGPLSVQLPPISQKAVEKAMAALAQFTGAVILAMDNEIVTRETGARLWAAGASEVGHEIDADAEIEALGLDKPKEEDEGEALVTEDYKGNEPRRH